MATTFLEVQNRAFSVLDAAINNSVGTLDLTAGGGASFPSSFPFHITIGSEIMSCTNRVTDTLTVTRAQQSTSGAAHAAAATVSLNITAKSISDLNTAVNTLEAAAPTAHAASHQNGGGDEINVGGLSGLLADQQLPAGHLATHQNGGGDEISVAALSGLLADDQHVLDSEVKLIKLDDFATPDDNTDLDFGTTRHGLVPKGTNVGNFLKDDGSWAAAAAAAHAASHETGGADEVNDVDINAGTIDGAVIGAASAAAITGTAVTGTSLVGGTVAGTTGTFSGILKTDDPTAATSATAAALLSAGGLGVVENIFSGGTQIALSGSAAGAMKIRVNNTNTGAGANAEFELFMDGTDSSTDTVIRMARLEGANTFWTQGLDNSDGDKYVWCRDTALGTSNQMTLSTAGLLSVNADGGGSDDPVLLFDDDDDVELAQQFAYANDAAVAQGIVTPAQRDFNRNRMVEKGLAEWAIEADGPPHLMVHVQPMLKVLAGGLYQTRAALAGEVTSLRQELAEVNRKLKAIGA